MEYDKDRVDDAALALLFLTMFKDHGLVRAWKGLDWDVLDRLFEKGFIEDPKGKAKSVILTEQGERRSEELFRQLFGGK
jgi:hypothetical protein